MAVATATELLYEGYDDLVQLEGREVAAAAEQAPFRLPPSWRAERASRTKLTAVVRGHGAQTETATGDVVYLVFRHGREALEIQVLEAASPAARLYVDAVLGERPLVDVAAGRGTIAGRSFILDTETHLVRATYDDGGPALSSVADPRIAALEDRARELLGQVQSR